VPGPPTLLRSFGAAAFARRWRVPGPPTLLRSFGAAAFARRWRAEP